MNLAVKVILVLISIGALAHLLLSDLDLFPNYQIVGPTFIAKSQKFSLIARISSDNGSVTITEDGDGDDEDDNNNNQFAQLLNTAMWALNISQESASMATVKQLSMSPQNTSLTQCPVTPVGLVGPIKVWFDEPSFEQLEHIYSFLEPGGHGKPQNCLARHRVAIILPYRDREHHLRIFLHNLHALLSKQQIDYGIFVVEQIQNETFNRAKLMNVGFTEANKLYDWQCYIFHDVDLLPEDDRNIYSCPAQPRHMSVAVDKFKYKLPYGSLFGGVTAMTREQFIEVNGFSNDYWGWGGEDDDLSARVTSSKLKIMRYPITIARYRMIKHSTEKTNPLNPCRYDLMAKTKVRQSMDGVSSVEYKLHDLQLRPLFTLIKAELLEAKSKKRLRNEGFRKC